MHQRAYLCLILATLFWGANAVAAKMAVGEISPMLLNALRWPLSVIVLIALSRRQFRRDLPVMRRHMGSLFLLGTVGMVGFSGALYIAVAYTSAINVSIEQAAMPGLVMLGNLLLFGTRARPAQIAGGLMTIAGVAVTALHGDLTSFASLDVNIGDAIMLFGVLCYAAYTIFLRYRPPMHWQSLMIALMLAATVSAAPFALWEFANGDTMLPTAKGWGIIAFTVIFPSLLAQPLYVHGTELIGSNRAGVFYNLTPIFGVLLSIVVLGEEFHAYHAAAIAMVIAGIWLAERRRPSLNAA
jgi:drug/metabolite transporter (DMT)-like permease